MTCRRLRPLTEADHFVVREIYADAIESQGGGLYSPVQISAWAALAWLPGVLDRPLIEGRGWLSLENDEVEAFALRYPSDRLAMLMPPFQRLDQSMADQCLQPSAKPLLPAASPS